MTAVEPTRTVNGRLRYVGVPKEQTKGDRVTARRFTGNEPVGTAR